jgi:hypothetical protein
MFQICQKFKNVVNYVNLKFKMDAVFLVMKMVVTLNMDRGWYVIKELMRLLFNVYLTTTIGPEIRVSLLLLNVIHRD